MREQSPLPAAHVASPPRVEPTLSRGPSTLRRDLLLRLRLDGPSSPDQLAERLGASRTRLLQQLRAPQAPNPATPQTVRHRVGRPRPLYHRPAQAPDPFPPNYDPPAPPPRAPHQAGGGPPP